MSEKLRFCVVGGGRIGTIHYQNIQKNRRTTLAAFIDVDTNRAKEIQQETGCAIYSSLNELFEDSNIEIDAFVICSPTCTHVEFSKLCISKGKPVLCEKPISMEPKEIKELSEYALSQKVPLLCGSYEFFFILFVFLFIISLGYHRRHDRSFRKLYDMVNNGEIGDLRTIRTCSRDNPIPLQNFLKISGNSIEFWNSFIIIFIYCNY